ncbi:MAG: ABC transporter permease [Acidobacteriota bacterium]
MNLREALSSAAENLAGHKLRSALTMLGMIFGVGAVIAMLSIGAGAEQQALEMIESLGLNNVLVRDAAPEGEELQEAREKSPGVSLRDVAAIEDAVPGVAEASPRVRIEPYRVLAAGGKSEALVFGVSHRHARLAGLRVSEGRFFDSRDEAHHGQVCVIGAEVRRELFGFGPAIGQDLKVNDVWFEVVGILSTGGATADSFQGVQLGEPAREIYVPVSTALRKFDQGPLDSPLSEIVVRLENGAPARRTGDLVAGLLDRLHAGAGDFELVVPEALLAQSRRTQRLFNLVMGCIAGISLLVGGIGIMNIMLATVLERTREIGVRRAVGARGRDIQFQFLTEAFAISLLGGIAGVVVGVAIARGVAAWADWETVVTLGSVLLSTGVAMAVGLASGYYPAVRAARLDPVDALRYE